MKFGLITFCLVFFHCFLIHSQVNFSFGVKPSIGIPVSIGKSFATINNRTYRIKSSIMPHGGIVGQLLWKDKYGLEIALDPAISVYSIPGVDKSRGDILIGNKGEIEYTRLQVPFLLYYKKRDKGFPDEYLKYLFGICPVITNILHNAYNNGTIKPVAINYMAGIRYGYDNMKFGRIEWGLHYMMPFNYSKLNYNYFRASGKMKYRTGYVIMGFYFFFMKLDKEEQISNYRGNLFSEVRSEEFGVWSVVSDFSIHKIV